MNLFIFIVYKKNITDYKSNRNNTMIQSEIIEKFVEIIEIILTKNKMMNSPEVFHMMINFCPYLMNHQNFIDSFPSMYTMAIFRIWQKQLDS